MSLGASHKGRIWSHQIANEISEWVDWCRRVGVKLLDDSISTQDLIDHVIVPKIIKSRPTLVPVMIEWPNYFLRRSDDAVKIEAGGLDALFYEADVEISTYEDAGPLGFNVVVDDQVVEYEIVFSEDVVEYVPTGSQSVTISTSTQSQLLEDWFQREPPVITFEDTSKLEYNEICRPTREREPYERESIKSWDWDGVDLAKESQFKKHRDPRRLEHRPDSIQCHVIERLNGDDFVDYDIIFDDDDTGEIADVVALRVAGDNLLVHFFHCKFAKGNTGVRVGDFYEVCGQAQKSVYWRSDVSAMFKRIMFREQGRIERYGQSRFECGDLEKLDELRRHARYLIPKFEIFIVQPGLDAENASPAVLDLLGATELYLRETYDVDMQVIAS